MGVAGACPRRPFIGQRAINFISRIDVAGAGAFSQWERLVPAPADLSVVNMLLDNESAAMLGMEMSFHPSLG
jgi:hypothetical protein